MKQLIVLVICGLSIYIGTMLLIIGLWIGTILWVIGIVAGAYYASLINNKPEGTV